MNTGKEQLIFGLDIGTRSVVGTVGYRTSAREFVAVAQSVRFHSTRAMLDGQIHDIGAVAATIGEVRRELESKTGEKLKGVCIAAAGRVLKTCEVRIDYDLEGEAVVDNSMIHSMELLGVEKASETLRRQEESNSRYFCVGYSVTRYYLGDVMLTSLEGHKGTRIGADILATFLPRDVTDGLYAATDRAGLEVVNLTLEPIAAINIAIPQKFRLLNLALVDVGAGTSDICITSGGSVTAYGMIPMAGDALTETLMQKFLVEFKTAEDMKVSSSGKKKKVTFKDIIGTKNSIETSIIRDALTPTLKELTSQIAAKIKELNGGKSPSAVFVVGGGGKAAGFTEMLAKACALPAERVALRGEEVLTEVRFLEENVKKDPMLVTPIGICLNYYEQNNNFIFVRVNGELVRLYDNGHITVMDAAVGIGTQSADLFPKKGDSITYTFNGKTRLVRGETGEGARISVNGIPAAITSPVVRGDEITIVPSTKGEPASVSVDSLTETGSICFTVNGKKIVCPRLLYVNGAIAQPGAFVCDGDKVEACDYYTAEQLFEYMDVTSAGSLMINNVPALPTDRIYENFTVDFEIAGDDGTLDNHYEMLQDVSDVGEGENNEAGNDTEVQKDAGEKAPQADADTSTATSSVPAASKPGPAGIVITVNGTAVKITGKDEYRLVDVLDHYPFDISRAGSAKAVIRINGKDSEFIDEIADGDHIDLLWQ